MEYEVYYCSVCWVFLLFQHATPFESSYQLLEDTVVFQFTVSQYRDQPIGKMRWNADLQKLETPGEIRGQGPFKLKLQKN